jgi:DNA-binding transcriptional LysR family regulator
MSDPDLDIGLLRAFEALYAHRNVTRAAEQLGISQPALSARLTRLRALFSDTLFTPSSTGRGVVPTARADQLDPRVRDLITRLARLGEPVTFEPATSERTFRLALYENPAVMLIPDLVRRLQLTGPNIRIAVIAPDPERMSEGMEDGSIDMFVGSGRTSSLWLSRTLFEEQFVVAQRAGHPRGRGRLTLDEYCALDHVLISAEGGGFSGLVDNTLAMTNRRRRVTVSVQTYALAPLIVANSDCLCTLPRRFLARYAAAIEVMEPPFALSAIGLTAFWHPRHQDDEGHAWLRGQMFAAAQEQGRS